MKNILFILAVTILTACYNNEDCSKETTLGPSHNYQIPTKIKFVSDGVYQKNQRIIDSLKTVEELLNHLELLSTNPNSLQEGPNDTEHTWVGGNGESFKE
jgi:hypothetical protein|tara:strand:- start:259 stop:558 length:300 start_codon:yes stop_codon:yes gene_type:complete